ncbi:MAG: acyl-CoA/acyl-ACP dehydrogenase [Ilumatobacteraceae bacterium]|nr:acyl-CoA/acyl-ACP dehydrogenase [Ilumatobacteraceae bacterium]
MNFDLSDEQQVISDLAAQIFSGQSTVDRVIDVESGDGFDRALWNELAKAGLLGLCLPEEFGGLNMNMVELVLVLEQQGKTVASVPLWSTSVASMAIAEYGSKELQSNLLSEVVEGKNVVALALANYGANDVMNPSVLAEDSEGGVKLSGGKPAVGFAPHASHVLVSAKRADDSIVLALVDLKSSGVTITPVEASNRQPTANIDFDVVVPNTHIVAGLQGNGREALRWVHEHALVGLCALQLGISQGAIGIMSEHVKTRTQFNKPLSAQQAVAVRAADQYVTTEAIRVTTLNAAWRMAEGFDARQDVLVAMYWATEGGHSIVIACQHLHGGIGADISYPVHRYFLWGIQISTELGGASQHLSRLGKLIASR